MSLASFLSACAASSVHLVTQEFAQVHDCLPDFFIHPSMNYCLSAWLNHLHTVKVPLTWFEAWLQSKQFHVIVAFKVQFQDQCSLPAETGCNLSLTILCISLHFKMVFHVSCSCCICGWWIESHSMFIPCVARKNGWECVVLCTEVTNGQILNFYMHAFKIVSEKIGKCISARWGHTVVHIACLLMPAWCMISTAECRLIWDLWAGHKACCTLVDYLFLFVLQGHKWIWGNQEICGHKVSARVPAALMALDDHLFLF